MGDPRKSGYRRFTDRAFVIPGGLVVCTAGSQRIPETGLAHQSLEKLFVGTADIKVVTLLVRSLGVIKPNLHLLWANLMVKQKLHGLMTKATGPCGIHGDGSLLRLRPIWGLYS